MAWNAVERQRLRSAGKNGAGNEIALTSLSNRLSCDDHRFIHALKTKITNKLAFACIQNAESLIHASKILFKKRLYGHASALAALATEECGKGFACTVVRDKDLKFGLSKDHKSHFVKLDWAAFDNFFSGLMLKGLFSADNPVTLEEYQRKFQDYLNGGNKDFPELLVESLTYKRLHHLKMLGLYVDVKDGKVLSPRLVKRKEAAFVIKLVEKRVAAFYTSHRVVREFR